MKSQELIHAEKVDKILQRIRKGNRELRESKAQERADRIKDKSKKAETMKTKTLTRNLKEIEVSTITLESGEVATAIFTPDMQEVLFSLSGGFRFLDQQIERTSKGWSKEQIHNTWTKAAGNRILIPDRDVSGSFRLIER